jgi:Flp pilus assembly protein TadG
MMFRKKRQGGNAMMEFAISAAILLPALAGSFQFGYTFYQYNLLQAAVSNGARYGMLRTYRCMAGETDVNKVKAAIRNMTVYGTPSPGEGAAPVVKGLTTDKIDVNFALTAEGLPTDLTVNVKNFTVKAIFQSYTFTGKPRLRVPYLGRYAAEESEL